MAYFGFALPFVLTAVYDIGQVTDPLGSEIRS
jgi:hypothetical protein